MRVLDPFRDEGRVASHLAAIRRLVQHPWTIMEICGGQTHTILQYGIEEMLPSRITLVHGPGCPVCVTPLCMIDAAIDLSTRGDVILATYGDMLRVPGSRDDLQVARGRGGAVRIIGTPLDAVRMAAENRSRHVVFFGIGFETTAPATAESILLAERLRLPNFSVLCAHVVVPPAIDAILASGVSRLHALIAPGHVCTVTGSKEYGRIARDYGIPVVVTGFEPLDIVQAVHLLAIQLETGRTELENQYARAVAPGGNVRALGAIERVFERIDRNWRGIGTIPGGGLGIRPAYRQFDAADRFDVAIEDGGDAPDCHAGEILQGLRLPTECPAFGNSCTPMHPHGAPMVSAEGACAAYYRYRRVDSVSPPEASPTRMGNADAKVAQPVKVPS